MGCLEMDVYEFLMEEVLEPKKIEVVLYFRQDEILTDSFGREIRKSYTPKVEEVLKEIGLE